MATSYTFRLTKLIFETYWEVHCVSVFMGNMFQDLLRLRETADNAERYI
jgi:hypothetical protein